MITNIKDLETELGEIDTDELELFLKVHIYEIRDMLKTGNMVLWKDGIYYCSNCSNELSEQESTWHYCSYCLVNYDCCDDDPGCEVCAEKVYELISKTYRKTHNI